MNTSAQTISITHPGEFKHKLLSWANRFGIFCFLDHNGYPTDSPTFDYLLAAGTKRQLELTPQNPFQQLKDFFEFDKYVYDILNDLKVLTPKADLSYEVCIYDTNEELDKQWMTQHYDY